jgi:hypothetical protein
MTTIKMQDIDWVISKDGYDVTVIAKIGDLSLGQRIYRFETKENAKKRAYQFISEFGSLY